MGPLLLSTWFGCVPHTAEVRWEPSLCARPTQAVPDHLDPYYTQSVDAHGIPVVAGPEVDPAALLVAADIVDFMLSAREDVRARLIASKVRVGILGAHQVTTDLPEHADLYTAIPGVDWDVRARGLGATDERPLVSAGEENLLRLPGDRYAGESILVHEFAHTMYEMGVVNATVTYRTGPELYEAYGRARVAGLYLGTYAATSPLEYWAEGVQSYFGVNQQPNHDHNEINTREELRLYDPALYRQIRKVFPEEAFDPYRCAP